MDNMVKLLSSDNEVFEVEAFVVQESKMLKTIIQDMGTEDAICLETVCSKVLVQVIEYCQYRAALHTKSDGNPAIAENEVTKWNAQFFNVDSKALVDLIQKFETRIKQVLRGEKTVATLLRKHIMDNMVKLLSSDNEVFELEASMVQESKMLKTIIEDMGTEDAIRLETVCSKVLAQVIEYCQFRAPLHTKSDGNPAIAENEVTKWNAQFFNVDFKALVDLIQAATFLNIQSLARLAGQAVVDMMVDKSPEEVRQVLNMRIKSSARIARRANQTGK